MDSMIRNYILMSISMNWWLDLDARMLEMKTSIDCTIIQVLGIQDC